MRKIVTISFLEIGRVFKRRQSYFLMFAMPLLFTLLFGSLLGSDEATKKVEIAVVDEDQSSVSKAFIEKLKQNGTFEFTESTLQDAKQRVIDKELTGYLLVQKGFKSELQTEELPQISFIHGPEFTSGMIVKEIAGNKLINVAIEVKASQAWANSSGGSWELMLQELSLERTPAGSSVEKRVVTKDASTQTMDNMSERAAGFAIMFVMIVMMSSTGTILEAKTTGVWSRLLTSPTSKGEIMLGYLVAFFVIGWIQFAVLMVSSSLLFNVSWGSLVSIILLVSAVLFCVIGLGLVIATYSKTIEQQAALGNLIVISTCMLGGVFWPLEIVPGFMQKIAEFVPQTWAMKGFTEITARGGSLIDILNPVLILLGFAVIFLLVGIKRVRFE
ncbi:ABC transporter permease [Fredinandcohnia humi]